MSKNGPKYTHFSNPKAITPQYQQKRKPLSQSLPTESSTPEIEQSPLSQSQPIMKNKYSTDELFKIGTSPLSSSLEYPSENLKFLKKQKDVTFTDEKNNETSIFKQPFVPKTKKI